LLVKQSELSDGFLFLMLTPTTWETKTNLPVSKS
jgi:hypothetical protein